MNKVIYVLTVSTLIMSMASCATIISGTKQKIGINSNIVGAEVKRNGNTICYTPCVQTFKRRDNPVLIIEKPGFYPQLLTMEKSFNGVAVLNLTWLVGWGVDAATGAISRYDESEYFITLKPDGSKVIIMDTIKTTKLEGTK